MSIHLNVVSEAQTEAPEECRGQVDMAPFSVNHDERKKHGLFRQENQTLRWPSPARGFPCKDRSHFTNLVLLDG